MLKYILEAAFYIKKSLINKKYLLYNRLVGNAFILWYGDFLVFPLQYSKHG